MHVQFESKDRKLVGKWKIQTIAQISNSFPKRNQKKILLSRKINFRENNEERKE